MSSMPAPQESFVHLWAGENPALHEALREELELSGIAYADKPLGEDEVDSDPLPIDSKPRFGFEVAVHYSDLPAAREILEKLLSEGELADVELPAEDDATEPETTESETQTGAARGERPSVSVWAGSDPKTIEFLTAALRENEIPMRANKEGGDLTVVYVPASSAPRAREIVREITEGVPPA